MTDVPRRVRTQAERDADGTTWRATADTRPGYCTYPTTPPGNPSWWRHDGPPPTPTTAAAGGPQPSDHDRCTKWCGFCHLGTSEPAAIPAGSRVHVIDTPMAPGYIPPSGSLNPAATVAEQPPADRSWIEMECAPTRRRWWHRYTRRTV